MVSLGGARETSNIVQNVAATSASSVVLDGTQDLSIHVSDLASDATVYPTGQELSIDGSALEGDLTLAVNADMLREGDEDVLIGTAGEDDLLALYGGMDSDTAVSGFETVQFGWTTGSNLDDSFETGSVNSGTVYFNTENATGVDQYVVGLRGGGNALELDNLAADSTVVLGDDSGVSVLLGGAPTILNADNGGALNLVMSDVVGSFDPADVQVNGFETINLDVASTAGTNPLSDDREIDLAMDDDARTLNITGGDADEDTDELEMGVDLNTSLTVIDVTAYDGGFTGAWGGQAGSNATLRAGGEDFNFDILGSFGDTALFRASQLGEDSDYANGNEITLEVNGEVAGFNVPATYTYTTVDGADRDATLEAMAGDLNGLEDTVNLGGNDYTITYNASFLNGAFSVEFSAVDEDGNAVDTQ